MVSVSVDLKIRALVMIEIFERSHENAESHGPCACKRWVLFMVLLSTSFVAKRSVFHDF